MNAYGLSLWPLPAGSWTDKLGDLGNNNVGLCDESINGTEVSSNDEGEEEVEDGGFDPVSAHRGLGQVVEVELGFTLVSPVVENADSVGVSLQCLEHRAGKQ